MARITFEYPDEFLPALTQAFCVTYGYTPVLPDGAPNPQTPGAFAAAQIVAYVKEVLKGHQVRAAADAARQQAAQEIDPVTVTVS